jgi:hypothetical protein
MSSLAMRQLSPSWFLELAHTENNEEEQGHTQNNNE